MTWTFEQQLDALMKLPWTIEVRPSDFGAYLAASVAELPDAIAVEDERVAAQRNQNHRVQALGRNVFAAIRASLASRLEFGDEIPLPPACALPWANGAEPALPRRMTTTIRGAKDARSGAWVASSAATTMTALV